MTFLLRRSLLSLPVFREEPARRNLPEHGILIGKQGVREADIKATDHAKSHTQLTPDSKTLSRITAGRTSCRAGVIELYSNYRREVGVGFARLVAIDLYERLLPGGGKPVPR